MHGQLLGLMRGVKQVGIEHLITRGVLEREVGVQPASAARFGFEAASSV